MVSFPGRIKLKSKTKEPQLLSSDEEDTRTERITEKVTPNLFPNSAQRLHAKNSTLAGLGRLQI